MDLLLIAQLKVAMVIFVIAWGAMADGLFKSESELNVEFQAFRKVTMQSNKALLEPQVGGVEQGFGVFYLRCNYIGVG